jgi:hypothetical protein
MHSVYSTPGCWLPPRSVRHNHAAQRRRYAPALFKRSVVLLELFAVERDGELYRRSDSRGAADLDVAAEGLNAVL